MDRQTYKFLLIVIAIAGFFYSAAFLHGLYTPEIRLLPDSLEYLAAAENLKDHGVFYSGSLKGETDYALYTRRTPGYPFLLCILSMVSPSLSLPVLFQVLLIFTGGFLFWRINEEMGIPPPLNVFALAVYLLYPGQIIYSQMIMAETILEFLILSSVYFLVLYLKQKAAVFIILVNLCLGFAVLCKPVMLYFWVPNLVLHLLLFRKTSRKIILAASLIPVLFISLWSWRNYQVTGVYHFSSLKASHMRFFIPEVPDKFESGSKAGFSEEFSKTERLAADILLNPSEAGSKIFESSKNMVSFFLDPGRFDIYRFIPIEGENISTRIFFHWNEDWGKYIRRVPAPILLYLGLLLLANLLIVLAFIPFSFMSGPDFFLRLYVLLIILYIGAVVSVAGLGAARYRLSVEPLLIAGAAAAAASAWQKFKNSRPPGLK
ncbi:MAG: hypothetical protein ABIJ42_09810 [Acidobacteriota bacterium]